MPLTFLFCIYLSNLLPLGSSVAHLVGFVNVNPNLAFDCIRTHQPCHAVSRELSLVKETAGGRYEIVLVIQDLFSFCYLASDSQLQGIHQ